jgi:NAD(P)-dependent dehydrogenase (short-subunit alcohol dehydrogenase family)
VHLLLPALQPPARVVLTSSGTHDPKTKAPVPVPKWTTPTDISMPAAAAAGDAASSSSSSPAKFNGMQAYTNSKLCNIYMAYQLAAKMKEQGKDITATAYGELDGEDGSRNKLTSWNDGLCNATWCKACSCSSAKGDCWYSRCARCPWSCAP